MGILEREQTLRLFRQMHQNDFYYDYWRRASGHSRCKICGLKFHEHPYDEENPLILEYYDRRLCNGDIVHL